MADRQTVLSALAFFKMMWWDRDPDKGDSLRTMLFDLFVEMQPRNGLTGIDARTGLYIRMNVGLDRAMLTICSSDNKQYIALATSNNCTLAEHTLDLYGVCGTMPQLIELLEMLAASYESNSLTFADGRSWGQKIMARLHHTLSRFSLVKNTN